jgi:exosortase family protein XrtF
MNDILAYWHKQTPLTKFLAKALSFYLIWMAFGASTFDGASDAVNNVLTENISKVGSAVMRSYGTDARSVGVPNAVGTFQWYIYINNRPYVVIENGCNGLVLMYLFAAFIIAFPGPFRSKLWYVPLGVFAIYWVNIIRIALLSEVIVRYDKSVSDFHHKYTFQLVVYIVIFIFWVIWANKFSKGAFNGPDDSKPENAPAA